MNEDFVPFELAKKLKEKGFPQRAFGSYDMVGPTYFSDGRFYKEGCICNTDEAYTAPTISQVLKWLREEKYIDIAILPLFVDYYKREYKVNIYATCFGEPYDSEYFHSYEKAELFAINYVLDNLI